MAKRERPHGSTSVSGVAALDPFALPTETEGRYRMLIAAALVLVWGAASYATPGLVLQPHERVASPEHRAIQDKVVEGGFQSLTAEELRTISEFETIRPYALTLGKWLARMGISMLLVLLTVAGAVAIYRLHPRWRGLLRRVTPLDADEAPQAVGELRRLISRAGLPREITLAHAPGRFGGLAFGTRGRQTLALCCPPDLLGAAWNRVMRPVAYHELGHIANDDIRNQEISRGIWIAALLLLTIIGVVAAILSPGPHSTLESAEAGVESAAPGHTFRSSAVRHLPFFVAVGWLWTGLVRIREHYADLRVVTWGERSSLLRRLRATSTVRSWWEGVPGPAGRIAIRLGIVGLFERFREHGWSFHPTPEERAAVVEDPQPLFRVSNGLAFLTGLLLTTVLAPMGLLFDDLTLVARSLMSLFYLIVGPLAVVAMVAVGLGAMIGLAHLVTGALGIQVQREAVARLAVAPDGSWGYARQGRVALLFALGLELGLLWTPASFLFSRVSPLHVAAWLAAFTALTWMWLAYVGAMSRFLLASHAGAEPPRRRQALVTWLSAFLLAVLYSPALAARVTLHRLDDPEVLASLGRVSPDPSEAFVYVFVMTSLVLLALGLLVYALVGLGSMALVSIWLLRRRQACSACGTPVAARLVAGRRCDSCGRPLARWLLLETRQPQWTGEAT